MINDKIAIYNLKAHKVEREKERERERERETLLLYEKNRILFNSLNLIVNLNVIHLHLPLLLIKLN
jgi:hypothetical protein